MKNPYPEFIKDECVDQLFRNPVFEAVEKRDKEWEVALRVEREKIISEINKESQLSLKGK